MVSPKAGIYFWLCSNDPERLFRKSIPLSALPAIVWTAHTVERSSADQAQNPNGKGERAEF